MSLARRLSLSTAPIAAVAVLCGAVAGCGSSSTGTSASPATVTPASAPLYVEAVVQPDGALKTNALASTRKLSGQANPFVGLLKLLQGPTGKAPDFAHEVKPWLGQHAGLFLSSIEASGSQGLLQEALSKGLTEGLPGVEGELLGSEGLPSLLSSHSAQGALVLDTTDVGRARSFLEAQGRSAGARSTSYRGIAYQVAPDGVAEGIVNRFAVIGSETGVKSVIDTALGGPPLARAAPYAKLTASAESGALANAYLDTEALTHAIKTSGSAESALTLVRSLLGDPSQAYISLIPGPSSFTLAIDTLPSVTQGGSHTTGAEVLRGLPEGSWLAIGIGDLSKLVGGSAQGLSSLASLVSTIKIGTISLEAVFAPFHSRALDVRRDLLSWTGATGVFVSGSSLINLRAALLITSKDPTRSRAAVAKLAQAYREAGGQTSPTSIPGTEVAVTVRLPNVPLPLTMAAGQGKFVVGLGSASIEEALHSQSTLAGTSAYNAAATALGQGIQPSVAIDFNTLTGLIESLGLNQAAGFSSIASALQPLSTLAVGGGASPAAGVRRARVVLALR